MRSRAGSLRLVDGVFVRSILEAVWLRFFKALEIEAVYEPERFPDGVTRIGYLPDIYLPEMNLYVEVKPTYAIFQREKDRPEGFVRVTEKRLMVVCGDPEERERYFLIPGSGGHVYTRWIDRAAPWKARDGVPNDVLVAHESHLSRRVRDGIQDRSLQEYVLEYLEIVAGMRRSGDR